MQQQRPSIAVNKQTNKVVLFKKEKNGEEDDLGNSGFVLSGKR